MLLYYSGHIRLPEHGLDGTILCEFLFYQKINGGNGKLKTVRR